MKNRRGRATVALGALVCLLAMAGGARAGGMSAYQGKVVVSATPFGDFATDDDLAKVLKSQATAVLRKDTDGWSVNFIAFLSSAAKDTTLHLVFYDQTHGKREYVNVYDFKTSASATRVSGAATLTTDDGFAVGHRYEVVMTRLVGGKEVVLARAKLTLADAAPSSNQ